MYHENVFIDIEIVFIYFENVFTIIESAFYKGGHRLNRVVNLTTIGDI